MFFKACVWMCVCACTYTCVHIGMCIETRGQLQESFLEMWSTSFETQFLIGWSSSIRLHWLTHAPGSFLPLLPPQGWDYEQRSPCRLSVLVLEVAFRFSCLQTSNSSTGLSVSPATLMCLRMKGDVMPHSESMQCTLHGQNHSEGGFSRD